MMQTHGYKFWNYVPSIAAAVIFMLLFLVMTGLLSWKLFRTRTWFCIAFTLGGLCMWHPRSNFSHEEHTLIGTKF